MVSMRAIMEHLSLLSVQDVQTDLSQWLRDQRKKHKWSRDDLAEKSLVPAATIKKFETTGQISLRQFLMLWQSVDDLARLQQLTKLANIKPMPTSIDEVLANEL
jgi:transcriptional regulator with XRE-family HTH domain